VVKDDALTGPPPRCCVSMPARLPPPPPPARAASPHNNSAVAPLPGLQADQLGAHGGEELLQPLQAAMAAVRAASGGLSAA